MPTHHFSTFLGISTRLRTPERSMTTGRECGDAATHPLCTHPTRATSPLARLTLTIETTLLKII